MAAIAQPSSANGSGRIRRQRSSLHIDMTPMVDLAFLLLTFFVLTYTLQEQFVIEVDMPQKTKEPPPVNVKKVLTVLLGEENKVYWYVADQPDAVAVTDFSPHGLRKVLLEKRGQIRNMVVLIKPSVRSRYQNLIDVLDEMEITNTERYALVKITPEDEALIDRMKNGNGD